MMSYESKNIEEVTENYAMEIILDESKSFEEVTENYAMEIILDESKSFEEVLVKNYRPEIFQGELTDIYGMMGDLKRLLDWNVELDDSLFNKEKGPAVIQDLMTRLKIWKSLNFSLDLKVYCKEFERTVICDISKLCVYYWISDSKMVSEILSYVYKCDGHFSFMMLKCWGGVVWSTENLEERRKLYLTMMFFLTHAHKTKMEISSVRFVDLKLSVFPSVYSASIFEKPELILLLLRHGAIVDRSLNGSQIDITYIIKSLKINIIRLWDYLLQESSELPWGNIVKSGTANDVWLSLRFLLRGIRQIPIGELEFLLKTRKVDGLEVTGKSHDFIRSISERGIVSTLASRYFEPPRLLHLCRLAIRDALNKNWNLPFGVFSLPLPKVLQRYLNLSED